MKTAFRGAPSQLARRTDKDWRFALWVILTAFVALRLSLVLAVPVEPTSDMSWYYQRALELLATGRYAEHGVATAYWPVGYPAFLAAALAVGGRSVLVAQLANLLLSLGCALLLYRLCMQRFENQRVALVAVALLAAYPNHIGYSAGLYAEPLFTLMLLTLCVVAQPDATISRIAALGFVGGLAALIKTQMLLLAPLLLLVLFLREWSIPALRAAAARTLLATVVLAATVAGWTYRNHVVLGAFVPVSTNGGMSLLAGNNPSVSVGLSGKDFDEEDALFDQVRFSVPDQVWADRRARTAAGKWISEHPWRFLALMPRKLLRMWLWDGESEWIYQAGYADYERYKNWFRAARVFNQFIYLGLLAGFVYALARLTHLSDPRSLAVPLAVGFFSVLSMVFSGQSRYHAPLMPFVIAYAAWALVQWRSLQNAP